MENFCRDYLLAVARTYAKATGMKLETVSRYFHGGVWFFRDFEAGSVTITLRKFDDMLEKFREEWPSNTAWPTASIKLKKKSGA